MGAATTTDIYRTAKGEIDIDAQGESVREFFLTMLHQYAGLTVVFILLGMLVLRAAVVPSTALQTAKSSLAVGFVFPGSYWAGTRVPTSFHVGGHADGYDGLLRSPQWLRSPCRAPSSSSVNGSGRRRPRAVHPSAQARGGGHGRGLPRAARDAPPPHRHQTPPAGDEPVPGGSQQLPLSWTVRSGLAWRVPAGE
ncbi:MAG: hypothetical protein AAGA56_15755 [Myxococcota bacterium]